MPSYYAIVPAAGIGSRFACETPKQYQLLAGRPLLYHSLAALCRQERIERVWVVLALNDRWWRQHDWTSLGYKLETAFCGGPTRSGSVANGLRAAATAVQDDDWLLVHDAARPCLSQAMLTALCEELAEDPVGGILAQPVADHLDDLAAAVVGQAEQVVQVLHLAQVLDHRAVVASGPPAVVAGQAEVLAADGGQPPERAGPDDQRRVEQQ